MIDISSRVLRAMIALEELRSFSLAAERSFVTQSALSQMVQKLERSVGVQLVDRDRRQVSFTPEGMRFIASAKRIMQELSEIDQDLRELVLGTRGRIGIAALPSLAAHWLPPIMARYRALFPAVELSLYDVPPQRALELVRTREADLAITADGPGRFGFESKILFKEKFVLVCHRSHPLAKNKRITLAQLNGTQLIRLVRTGSISQNLEAALRPLQLIDTGLEVDQVATVAGLVANNLGISVVPELTVPYFSSSSVVAVPIDAPDLYRPIYLVWPSARTTSRATREFIKILDESTQPKDRKIDLKARPPARAKP